MKKEVDYKGNKVEIQLELNVRVESMWAAKENIK